MKPELYMAGKIVKVLDPVSYIIEADIPGIIQGVKAFPVRSTLDEPVVGEIVLLRQLDPDFHSYYTYEKLKEDDYIGIRSNGKAIDISPSEIRIGIFSDQPTKDNPTPKLTSFIKIDKSGNIEVSGEGTITVKGESDIKIESTGEVTVKGETVKVTGGKLKVSGSSSPRMTGGPFNAIKMCPFTGAPHCGDTVTGT